METSDYFNIKCFSVHPKGKRIYELWADNFFRIWIRITKLCFCICKLFIFGLKNTHTTLCKLILLKSVNIQMPKKKLNI
jgi:hypothetical protein